MSFAQKELPKLAVLDDIINFTHLSWFHVGWTKCVFPKHTSSTSASTWGGQSVFSQNTARAQKRAVSGRARRAHVPTCTCATGLACSAFQLKHVHVMMHVLVDRQS